MDPALDIAVGWCPAESLPHQLLPLVPVLVTLCHPRNWHSREVVVVRELSGGSEVGEVAEEAGVGLESSHATY